MIELSVSVASHHVLVTRVSARARPAINGLSMGLVHYGFSKAPPKNGGSYYQQREEKKPPTYAASRNDRKEFRYHINHLPLLRDALQRAYINDTMVEWKKRPVKEGVDVKFVINPKLSDLERQKTIIEYILDDNGPTSKLVEAQTGIGKSYCGMRWMQHVGKRTVIQLQPKYIEQWLADLKDKLIIDPKRIVVIAGDDPKAKGKKMSARDKLMSLCNMAGPDFPYDIVILSSKTLQNWIKEYKTLGDEFLNQGWACTPGDFYEHIGAGARLIDEVHSEFHLNFLSDLYTHCYRSLSLSATLLSDDLFVNKMYQVAYPKPQRYQAGEYLRYVNAYALEYAFNDPDRIRTTERGMTTYSHHAFEKSIIKQPKVLYNYFQMIKSTLVNTYIKNYRPNQRALIFCASIDMCTRLVEFLREHFPSKDVRRYVEDDPRENLEADISVSTLQSAGTGIDIKGLASVILTTAVRSSQTNVQGFGRLRLPADGSTPEFTYLICRDVGKHIDYHEAKLELLKTRALKVENRYYAAMV